MKAIFTTGLIAALLAGPALAGSERGGCGYGAEASVSKAGQSAVTRTDSQQRSTAESEGVLTAQSSDKPTTIREDENLRSGGTHTGGSGAPAPNTVKPQGGDSPGAQTPQSGATGAGQNQSSPSGTSSGSGSSGSPSTSGTSGGSGG